jgi:soluble lytic murein transglycosylase-like protein
VKTFFLGFTLAASVIGSVAPAGAQIYTWRDAGGTLVLSDRPLSQGARSFPVPRTEAVRVTTPLLSRPTAAYESLIREHASREGVRPDLVRAVIQVESGFNARAVSPKGARGLMQLMPATAAQLGVRNAFDPAENIRAGVVYLRSLLDRYNNEELALAAYNAGPGAVDRYDSQVPPYRETKDYVRRIRAVTALAAIPGRLIYKSVEIVDGRPVPRYSDAKPSIGNYEVIAVRR